MFIGDQINEISVQLQMETILMLMIFVMPLHINKLPLLPWLLWRIFGPGFFLRMSFIFKVRRLGAFLGNEYV